MPKTMIIIIVSDGCFRTMIGIKKKLLIENYAACDQSLECRLEIDVGLKMLEGSRMLAFESSYDWSGQIFIWCDEFRSWIGRRYIGSVGCNEFVGGWGEYHA